MTKPPFVLVADHEPRPLTQPQIKFRNMRVITWSPESYPGGTPTALQLRMFDQRIGQEAVFQMDTREQADQIIDALVTMRKMMWPTEG